MKLGLGEPTPTKITIQLADWSIRHPRDVVEGMLVKVDKFIFSVDFIILEVNEEVEAPLILSHPFLATSKALIDVNDGQMVLQVGEEKFVLKLHRAMRHSSSEYDTCFSIDVTNDVISNCVQEILREDPLDELLGQVEDLPQNVEVMAAFEKEPLL